MKIIKFILSNRVLLSLIVALAIDTIFMGINEWLYLLVFLTSIGLIAYTWSVVYDGEKQSRSEQILLDWLERNFR